MGDYDEAYETFCEWFENERDAAAFNKHNYARNRQEFCGIAAAVIVSKHADTYSYHFFR